MKKSFSPPPSHHPLSLVESDHIGKGTRIWAFSHVQKEVSIGANCNIGENCFLESGVRVGNRVTLKNGVFLWTGITVKDDVFIGPNATFANDRYPRSPRFPGVRKRYQSTRWLEKITLEKGCTIGANATIVGPAKIGAYSMIGAGAVITRNVPAYALMVGNPARQAGWVNAKGERVLTKPQGSTHS